MKEQLTLEAQVIWSRGLFDSLSINGVWAVPRSRLIFKKVDADTFRLIENGPGVALDYQKEDFEAIAQRFRLAGVTVEDGCSWEERSAAQVLATEKKGKSEV